MLVSLLIETEGNLLTVICTEPVVLHPKEFWIVTVYFVEEGGVATGLEILSLVNPAEGVHEYFVPPDASSCTAEFSQMLVSFEMVMKGLSFTFISTEPV